MKKFNPSLPCLLIFISFLFSSCSSVIVSQDFDNSTSFTPYSLFSFEPKDPERLTDRRADNDLLNNRFINAIRNELIEKGLEQGDNTNMPALRVSFHYSIRPKMDMTNIYSQVGFSYGSYYRSGGVGLKTCTDISEFDQGILMIDIKDAANGNLIWRGTGTDIVSIHATPEKITSQVDKIVSAVLDQFPPQ